MHQHLLSRPNTDGKDNFSEAVDPAVISHLGRRFRLRPLIAIVIAQAIGLGAH
jgi:hypothetical protein